MSNYTICLNCGNVQVRTDILNNISEKYILLDKKIQCPRCNEITKMVATKNIKILKKELSLNQQSKMDTRILKLIG